jgi:hypothetical protein
MTVGEEDPMPKDILGRPILTAADLDAMTPEQRRAAFEASIVTDLDQLPPDYLARLRTDAEELAARRDAAQRDVPHAS